MSRVRPDADAIRAALTDPRYTILTVAETVSTNETLRAAVREGREPPTVLVAGSQPGGRGRLARSWHGPPGLGLYLTLHERLRVPLALVTRATLAAGVAAAETCRSAGADRVALEWPNDLVVAGRKLGGILTECRASADGPLDLFVGVGINVAHAEEDFPDDLRSRATSLAIESPASVAPTREALAAGFLDRWSGMADELRAGMFDGIRRRFLDLCAWRPGRTLDVHSGGRLDLPADATGRFAGVDEAGALLVSTDAGTTLRVTQADSVRAKES